MRKLGFSFASVPLSLISPGPTPSMLRPVNPRKRNTHNFTIQAPVVVREFGAFRNDARVSFVRRPRPTERAVTFLLTARRRRSVLLQPSPY